MQLSFIAHPHENGVAAVIKNTSNFCVNFTCFFYIKKKYISILIPKKIPQIVLKTVKFRRIILLSELKHLTHWEQSSHFTVKSLLFHLFLPPFFWHKPCPTLNKCNL